MPNKPLVPKNEKKAKKPATQRGLRRRVRFRSLTADEQAAEDIRRSRSQEAEAFLSETMNDPHVLMADRIEAARILSGYW